MPLFSPWWYRPDSAAMPTPPWETVFIWAVSRSKHFFPSQDKDKPQNFGGGVMGKQVKAFAKSWDLSLTSEFHMVEGENRLMAVDFWPPHILLVLTLLHPTQGWRGGLKCNSYSHQNIQVHYRSGEAAASTLFLGCEAQETKWKIATCGPHLLSYTSSHHSLMPC